MQVSLDMVKKGRMPTNPAMITPLICQIRPDDRPGTQRRRSLDSRRRYRRTTVCPSLWQAVLPLLCMNGSALAEETKWMYPCFNALLLSFPPASSTVSMDVSFPEIVTTVGMPAATTTKVLMENGSIWQSSTTAGLKNLSL